MITRLPSKTTVVAALLALPGLVHAQAPTLPSPTSAPAVAAEPAPRRLLLKLGLTPTRILPQYRYSGLNWVIAPSLGAEYQLGPHVTVYSQADIDFSFSHRDYYFVGSPQKEALVHSGAVGLGLRYYYNQAGRERHNRAHGPFVGNYLALEAMTELSRQTYYDYDYDYNTSPYPIIIATKYRTQAMPLLNVYWGLQRRLGGHFLYDVNIGVGLIAKPSYYPSYYYGNSARTLYHLDGDLAINLRLYVVR